jgi:hypothetical protein
MTEKDTSKIPKGHYCYTPIFIGAEDKLKLRMCPYWSNHPEHGHQESGHCSYMNISDWNADHFTHLWDMVKECDINMGYEDVE